MPRTCIGTKIRVCYSARNNPHQSCLSNSVFKVIRILKNGTLWANDGCGFPIGPIKSWIRVRA